MGIVFRAKKSSLRITKAAAAALGLEMWVTGQDEKNMRKAPTLCKQQNRKG
jgi:hypothetical protein